MLDSLPVFGICGWSGSGKTTLVEQLVPELSAQGLRVAVVKHDAHGLDIDREGKDSDRLFKAGADVLMRGPGQMFFRGHDPSCLEAICQSLGERYDVILVEGHKGTPLPKVWLLGGRDGSAPPPEVTDVVACLPRDADATSADTPGAPRGRVREVLSYFSEWLPQRWLKTPLYGCVIAPPGPAGESLDDVGAALPALSRVVERIVVSSPGAAGTGEWDHVPPAPDASDRRLAGLLAAMRWQPHVSWIVVKQTNSAPSEDALRQLLGARRVGVWAATLAPRGPLYVDFRAGATVGALATKSAARGSDFQAKAAEIITGALAPEMAEAYHPGDDNGSAGR